MSYADSVIAPSHKSGYSEPVFVEPPSFLKEYETQSLAMYVPPDEPIQEQGEVNMTFQADDDGRMQQREARIKQPSSGKLSVEAASHDSGEEDGFTSVNPIYQSTERRPTEETRNGTHPPHQENMTIL